MMDDRERLILLNLIQGIGSLRTQQLLEVFGSLAALWEASEAQLRQIEGIGPVLAQRIIAGCRNTRLLRDELQAARRAGCTIVTRIDDGFPIPLKAIYDPPLALAIKGAWTESDQTAVGMVGSRRASLYGQQTAERFAYELAIRGVTVVSGLARGIDAAAHRGALKAGGRTLAVLGSGLSRIYPPEHDELAEEVVGHGALISEYPMGMEPLAQNFPRRNRLISGLSLGVVIVEAARRSGALITADCALEQGREVFAVPGKVDAFTSQGTNALLKQGAKLVTSIEDILEELRLEPVAVRPTLPLAQTRDPQHPEEGMTSDEQTLLAHLSSDAPTDVDGLAARAGLPVAMCSATLLGLELKRLVTQLPGKRFIRRGPVTSHPVAR